MSETNKDFNETFFWTNHRALLAEYTAASPSDDDRIRLLKEAVDALDVPDRTLLVAYAESGSLRKTSELYGFSAKSTRAIRNRLEIIRKKIAQYVANHR